MKLALKIGPALRARRLDVEDIAEKVFPDFGTIRRHRER